MLRLVMVLGLSAALSAPALAMMPPYVYAEARDNAVSVLVFEVNQVLPPPGNMGNCVVEGTVLTVERGTAYSAGDAIKLSVNCLGEYTEDVPVGGTIWQDTEELAESKFGRAYLDGAGGVVLDQYEQLESPDQTSAL